MYELLETDRTLNKNVPGIIERNQIRGHFVVVIEKHGDQE